MSNKILEIPEILKLILPHLTAQEQVGKVSRLNKAINKIVKEAVNPLFFDAKNAADLKRKISSSTYEYLIKNQVPLEKRLEESRKKADELYKEATDRKVQAQQRNEKRSLKKLDPFASFRNMY